MIEQAKKSFDKQGFMKTLGAKIIAIEKGMVKIACDKNKSLTQQHGYFHAGVITSIADVACGYAAHTTMPLGSEVLSVEFNPGPCFPKAWCYSTAPLKLSELESNSTGVI